MLRAKLAPDSGDRAADVVAANTVELAALLARDELRQDLACPRSARQLPRFRGPIEGIVRNGKTYAVPTPIQKWGWCATASSSAHRPSRFPYCGIRAGGKVSAFDGATHAFSLAALEQGQFPPFRIAQDQLAPLARHLVRLRRNLLSLYSLPEESVDLFRRHRVAVMHANYGQQQLNCCAMRGSTWAAWCRAKRALAWLDCWAVLRRSAQQALAAVGQPHAASVGESGTHTRRQRLANAGGAGGTGQRRACWAPLFAAGGGRCTAARVATHCGGDRPERF